MDLNLDGRVALVTGCSVGIGREIAKQLAAEGAQTVVTARRAALLATLEDEIVAHGDLRPLVVPGDLYQSATPAQIADAVVARFGGADIVVNNAGGSQPVVASSPEDIWERAYTLNFIAIRRLTDALLPGMKARHWGRVIIVGGNPEPARINATSAAKSAAISWAKGLSREVGSFGITVNAVSPGRINSEQIMRLYSAPDVKAETLKEIPLGYYGEPGDVAAVVAFLCSAKARYLTGQRIDVDGGRSRGAW
jgi:3-oxoacyl-[acyl-carrier protein] reductase